LGGGIVHKTSAFSKKPDSLFYAITGQASLNLIPDRPEIRRKIISFFKKESSRSMRKKEMWQVLVKVFGSRSPFKDPTEVIPKALFWGRQ
jgi:hypothetical protein